MSSRARLVLGYVVYSVKQKLKQEYAGLSGREIRDLRLSGVEGRQIFVVAVTNTITVPEIAFTGDTMSDFIADSDNVDVLRAKILILESTFINDTVTVEDAKEYGHTHLSEIVGYADKFQNKAILLIHFSARHKREEIEAAVSALEPPLSGRVFALTQGF
ncbi:tRNase Z TRZ1-like [Punica granatum]|uniref:TRNase Z TRZ1-like n=1 Tax=Punica granatum TaxID=22663 RepID=A0A6P8E7B1_PUNGR|nr:tRNase Z TRZ1-like [Punica granatum]